MGRPKAEMKRIHAQNIKKAKEKIKLYRQGQIRFSQLNARAKKLLQKSLKQQKNTPAQN